MTVPDQAIPELEEFAYKVAGRQPAILGLPGYQVDFVPGEPLLMINVIERRFVFFGQTFWPQDIHLFVLGFITFIIFVALFTVAFGVGQRLARDDSQLIAGASVGAFLAARVAMTAMPQLVAMLHSFVGLAAVLVGVSTSLAPVETVGHAAEMVHRVEIWLGVAVGAVTFTGSVIAWAKLD